MTALAKLATWWIVAISAICLTRVFWVIVTWRGSFPESQPQFVEALIPWILIFVIIGVVPTMALFALNALLSAARRKLKQIISPPETQALKDNN